MKVAWAPLAIDRVAETSSYIAEDNPGASEKWVRNVFTRVEQLASFPHSGNPLLETARRDIRELILGDFRIIYRVDVRLVSILTVRSAKPRLPLEDMK